MNPVVAWYNRSRTAVKVARRAEAAEDLFKITEDRMSALVPISQSRSSLSNPDGWLIDIAGGSRLSKNAPVINNRTALNISAVYGCISFISQTAGMLPLEVFQNDKTGKPVEQKKHPVYKVAHTAPNPAMTPMSFKETLLAHALSTGNGYAEIEWTFDMKVKALWSIPPHRVRPEWGKNEDEGDVVYRVTLPNGKEQVLKNYQVLHIYGLGYNGFVGYSVVGMARRAFSAAAGKEIFDERVISEGTAPSSIVTLPPSLWQDKERKKFIKDFNESNQGLSQTARNTFLRNDVTMTPSMWKPVDVEFLASRVHDSKVIAAQWFHLDPSVIGIDGGTSQYKVSSDKWQSSLTSGIQPWLTRVEQAWERALLSPVERDTYYIRHDTGPLLRMSMPETIRTLKMAIESGQMDINEARGKLNLGARDGGEILRVSQNTKLITEDIGGSDVDSEETS